MGKMKAHICTVAAITAIASFFGAVFLAPEAVAVVLVAAYGVGTLVCAYWFLYHGFRGRAQSIGRSTQGSRPMNAREVIARAQRSEGEQDDPLEEWEIALADAALSALEAAGMAIVPVARALTCEEARRQYGDDLPRFMASSPTTILRRYGEVEVTQADIDGARAMIAAAKDQTDGGK